MKKVAVVILNWNGKSLLERFLPSVIAHTPEEWAEVVVADNGSTDQSVEMLREKFPSVRLVLLDRNYGFAEGYNRALAEIKDTAYTVLLNSDVEVTPHWLDEPLQALEEDVSLAGVQPKIRDWKKRDRFEYAGAGGGFIDRYGYPFCRGRILSCVENDRGQYDRPAAVFWVSGACFFIRTDVYKKEGGLDAGFFAHQEEIDLCWRLRSRGYRLICTPQSVVYHVGGGTLGVESPQKTFLNFRNNLLMVYKNVPEKELARVMRLRFWLDYMAAARFLLTGYVNNACAVVRARKAFRQLKKAYLPARRENLAKTVTNTVPEMLRSNVLLCFYLKRKKTFAEVMPRH
ncbi:MAG: glycosyltransferase family 2 protein [Tannerella sp.]|jgi:GT2 family glycosyltransferase|nr:glycosyltransferase family 2 protein [Tannerella sp.]